MTLTVVWLVLALLASWASTARADDVSPSGGQPVDTTSSGPSTPPGPADGTGPPGGGSSDPGTPPTSAGDPNPGSPPTQPADPPPAQETSPPVTSPPTPPDNTAGGVPQGSPGDSTAGGGTTVDTSSDPGASDPTKKASPSKSGTDSQTAGAPSSDQGPVAPAGTSQPSDLGLSGAPGDEMWVDQWSAFTHSDPAGLQRQNITPGIRLARGSGFVLFRTSKAKQFEDVLAGRARRQRHPRWGAPWLCTGYRYPAAGLFNLLAKHGGGGAVLIVFGVLGSSWR